ncbi:hypothetical protein D9757_009741 [Collybiopsis confluens]|uniref:BED-type domain-containing protein n=1 Tax=Collybiopsis confluens TaxID=2823264 RepID=A0A8H5GYW4_9AGAR|nr:hypothetical protein D9757_009741 [Collybiopsis confluens]
MSQVPHVTTRLDILPIRPRHRVRLASPRPLKASVFSSPFERQTNQPYPGVTNASDVTGTISVDAAEPSSGTRNGTSLVNGTVVDTLRSSLGIMPDRNFARNGRGQTDVLATAIPRNTAAPDVLVRNMEQIDVRKGNRIPVGSTLQAEAWKAALDELNLTPKYPTLPYSIHNGFNVGIPIIQHTYSPANNLQSPESQRAFIEVMTNELRVGRWLGPYSAQEIESVLGLGTLFELGTLILVGFVMISKKHGVVPHLSSMPRRNDAITPMPNGTLQTTFRVQAAPTRATRNSRNTLTREEDNLADPEDAVPASRSIRNANKRSAGGKSTASRTRQPAARPQQNGPPADSLQATPPPRQQRVRVHFIDESPGEAFDFSGLLPESPTNSRARGSADFRASQVSSNEQSPLADSSDSRLVLCTPGIIHATQSRTPVAARRTPISVRQTPRTYPVSIGRSLFHHSQPRAGTRGGPRAADVWTFFTDVEGKSTCHFCRKLMEAGKLVPFHEYGQQTGTDGRRQHLIKNHRDEWIESCIALDIKLTAGPAKIALREYQSRKGLSTDTIPFSTASQTLPHGPFSKDAFIDSLMIWIVADDQSLNVVDNQHFRNMLMQLRSQLRETDIPHRDTLRARILESVNLYWTQISQEMQNAEGAVSITDDIWTDIEKRSFLAITGHWIMGKMVKTSMGEKKELVMRSALIGFVCLPGSHTGHHIAEAFVSVMEKLGLLNKRINLRNWQIGWITSDNASNNDTFMTSLAQSLHACNPGFVWDPHERRIRCFAHIVNLACKALLAELEEMGNQAMSRLRQLVKMIRGSNIRRAHFLACVKQIMQKELQLILDMDIRWSSTYLMVDRAILLRLAISRFFTFDDFQDLARIHFLSENDWALLVEMKDALECLSAEKTPTLCDAIPAFEAMVAKWSDLKSIYPRLSYALEAGLAKLQDYINLVRPVPAYTLAMAINPAMKLDYYQLFEPDRFLNAKNLFIDAIKGYITPESVARPQVATTAAPETVLSWADRMLQGSMTSLSSSKQSAEEEVDRYLAERSLATSSLLYWQENCTRYPTIYKLAMDILPIQGTSVPSERVFSSAGETNTKRRSRVSPDLMQALQVLKFGIKTRDGLSFTAGLSREEELQRLELFTDECFAIPTDMRAYIDSLHTDMSHVKPCQVKPSQHYSQGAVRDISEAYRLIPLHTSQKAGAVIRVSDQEFCIDTRLMFGLSASGGIFGHLADAGMEIARGKGLGPVTKWVDDHLWLRILRVHLDEYNKLRKELQERVRQSGGVIHNKGRLLYRGHTLPSGQQEEFDDDFTFPLIDMSGASSRSVEDLRFTYAFCDIDQVTLPLGYTWALEKDIPFCESPTYFGFQWHLETRTVSIPAEKRAKYSECINRWEEQPTHDLDEATTLYGKLLHVSLVLRRGKAYLTELEKFIANLSHVASHVRHHVPRHWPADLAWWKDILAAPISSRIPGPTNLIDVHAYSDASSGYGIGLYIRGYWRAYRLLPGWKGNHNERDIGWAEAVGFYLLVQTIRGQATRGHQYKIWGDNEGVVEGWWNGRSRNRDTNNIFQYIHEITTTNDFGVHTRYVPSAHNPADPFSRGQHGPHNLLLPRIPIPPHLSEFIVDYDTPYSATELSTYSSPQDIAHKVKHRSAVGRRSYTNTQHVTTANILRYPQNLNPLSSPLRPHCPARDRLITWKPATKRSLKDAAGNPLALPEEYLERIQMLMQTGYAESTRETYASGLLAFHVFCDTQNIPEDQRAPCGRDLLNAWMATMAGSYAGTSIKNYVHGVRAWHIIHGIEWELDQATFDTMIHGAERLRPAQSRLKKRQPYTVDYITQILTDLDRTNPFDVACGACLTTAFYCVARLGELTVPTLKDFSPNKHVTTQSIREDTDRNGLRTTVIHVPCTKASQTQGEDIYFSKQLGTTDPDEWLKLQLTTNKPATTEHLFAYSQRGSTRKPLTKHAFIQRIHKAAKNKGLPALQGHGIRIGATLEYLLRGVPFDVVRAMGRWQSDAFLLYLRKHAVIMAPYMQPELHHNTIRYTMPPVRWVSRFAVPSYFIGNRSSLCTQEASELGPEGPHQGLVPTHCTKDTHTGCIR